MTTKRLSGKSRTWIINFFILVPACVLPGCSGMADSSITTVGNPMAEQEYPSFEPGNTSLSQLKCCLGEPDYTQSSDNPPTRTLVYKYARYSSSSMIIFPFFADHQERNYYRMFFVFGCGDQLERKYCR